MTSIFRFGFEIRIPLPTCCGFHDFWKKVVQEVETVGTEVVSYSGVRTIKGKILSVFEVRTGAR